jgi:hypothetical protein
MTVSSEEIDGVLRAARERGVPTFSLSTGDGAGRDAFFDAVRDALPLDPPLVSNRSWDALSDSLFGGLHALGVDRVVVVWPDAPALCDASPTDYATAVSVLTDVSESMAEPKYTNNRPTELSVYLASA